MGPTGTIVQRTHNNKSRSSSVGVVIRLRAGRSGYFLLTTASTAVLGSTQSSMQWVSGALSPGIKRPER